LLEEKVDKFEHRLSILDYASRLQPGVYKNHDFDALNVIELLFGDEFDLASEAGVHDNEVMEVLLVLNQFDGHGVVQDLHVGQLIVGFAILGAHVESEHSQFL